MDHKDMDFKSQAIFSASNGPNQPYFGPYKSNHEWASTKATWYVKENLLEDQWKKNQARKLIQPEDSLGLLKLAKSILSKEGLLHIYGNQEIIWTK